MLIHPLRLRPLAFLYPCDSAPSTSTPAPHPLIVPLRLHPLCFRLSDSAPLLLPLRLRPLSIYPSALSDFPPLTPPPLLPPLRLGPFLFSPSDSAP